MLTTAVKGLFYCIFSFSNVIVICEPNSSTGKRRNTCISLAIIGDSRYIAARLKWDCLLEETVLASLEEVTVGNQVVWLLNLVWRK